MITFQPTNMGMTFNGNSIAAILPQGQADQLGVRKNWTILEINGRQQPNATDKINAAIDETFQLGQPTMILFQTHEGRLKNLHRPDNSKPKLLKPSHSKSRNASNVSAYQKLVKKSRKVSKTSEDHPMAKKSPKVASAMAAKKETSLWKVFEKKLAEEETQFSEFDADTDWRGVLEELGFSALKAGKLMRQIKKRYAANDNSSSKLKKKKRRTR